MKRFQGVVERVERFGVTAQSGSQRAQPVDVATGFQLRQFRLQFCSFRRESFPLFP